MKGFEKLNTEEKAFMLKVPSLVALLIAGADGKVDHKEIQKGFDMARKNQSAAEAEITAYYETVANMFDDEVDKYSQNLSADLKKREEEIITLLRKVNEILPNLSKDFAVKLHGSYKEIAMKVAEATGGVMGIMSVASDEARVVGLSMIHDPEFIKYN